MSTTESKLRRYLYQLLDAIHAGRFVPVSDESKGYCASVVNQAEEALALPASSGAEPQVVKPPADAAEKRQFAEVEATAKEIYAGWKSLTGWVPWVENGNSDRQCDARRLAWRAIDTALAQAEAAKGVSHG